MGKFLTKLRKTDTVKLRKELTAKLSECTEAARKHDSKKCTELKATFVFIIDGIGAKLEAIDDETQAHNELLDKPGRTAFENAIHHLNEMEKSIEAHLKDDAHNNNKHIELENALDDIKTAING